MKFVELKPDSSADAVAFVNPNMVMAVEAHSRNATTSKLFFGGTNFLTVVGRPEDIAFALSQGTWGGK
jgi:hypothetical protein